MGCFPELPPGYVCSVCDGILWAAGETPSIIIATFSGIEKSLHWEIGDPPPGNGNYTLYQDPFWPCYFVGGGPEVFAALDFRIDKSVLLTLIGVGIGKEQFIQASQNCGIAFTNAMDGTYPDRYQGGHAVITW